MPKTRSRVRATLPLLALAFASAAGAQTGVTTPEQQFGHRIGADYVLPDYTQFVDYWQKLARESDRMVLDTIGLSAEGRPQLMAIITAPENHRNLERYQDIARRLALAEGLTDDQARQLAAQGRAVVWFDGGLHATEVLGAQQLIETVYQLVSGTDAETLRILNDVIILFVDKLAELERRMSPVLARLHPDGGLWIAWPKKAARKPTDITEDVVRRIGLAGGLVDNKVAAIDDVWAGLRLVVRVENREAVAYRAEPPAPKRKPRPRTKSGAGAAAHRALSRPR